MLGSSDIVGATVFDSVTGSGCELLNWQQEAGALEKFISMPLCPGLILAIIGQSGGHCIEPGLSGTHIASDRNGSMTTIAKTPVDTTLCQNRMIYFYSQL